MKIGIDIGGSHIAIGVVDSAGSILAKNEKRLTGIEKQDIKKAIKEYIIEQVKWFQQRFSIKEIGIGMPGWAENGVVRESGNLSLKNYAIAEDLQTLSLPIKIKNDAKCAAMAENEYGCLKEYNRSIFLTLGTGIGGAAFLHHELLKVGKKPGYEFGHMVIEKEGIPCHCGRKGCFERYASMKAFKNNLRKALHLEETTAGEKLLEILQENSPQSNHYETIEKIVSQYIDYLSVGIQNLICIFEPEVIGIGGSFVYFEEVFLKRLIEKIQENNQQDVERSHIKIKTATLGNDAGIIGAVL